MEKFDIDNVLKLTELKNELELEKAIALQSKLRWMSKEDTSLKPIRKHLRNLIAAYENKYWADENAVTDEQIVKSDKAAELVKFENQFNQRRKDIIKDVLNKLGLNQQNLAQLLGHRKNYMSELINGVHPFSTSDIVVIHRLLKIKLEYLIPPFVNDDIVQHIKETVKEFKKPKLRLVKTDFHLEVA